MISLYLTAQAIGRPLLASGYSPALRRPQAPRGAAGSRAGEQEFAIRGAPAGVRFTCRANQRRPGHRPRRAEPPGTAAGPSGYYAQSLADQDHHSAWLAASASPARLDSYRARRQNTARQVAAPPLAGEPALGNCVAPTVSRFPSGPRTAARCCYASPLAGRGSPLRRIRPAPPVRIVRHAGARQGTGHRLRPARHDSAAADEPRITRS